MADFTFVLDLSCRCTINKLRTSMKIKDVDDFKIYSTEQFVIIFCKVMTFRSMGSNFVCEQLSIDDVCLCQTAVNQCINAHTD